MAEHLALKFTRPIAACFPKILRAFFCRNPPTRATQYILAYD